MHYEVELGLIMGKTVRDLDPEDTKGAMDAIAGICFYFYSTTIVTDILISTRRAPTDIDFSILQATS
jgi:hypothetical protein